MTRVPGIGAVAPLVALAVALPIWLLTFTTPSLARQEGDLALVEVGAGPVREQALGFTGRNVYGGESVELFGYLTTVIGLEQSLLVTDADAAPTPQTARFTYSGTVSITSRTDRADITTIAGDGVLRIFFNNAAGASWDDSGSFAAGEPVAEYAIQFVETLHRQAPGVGVLVGDGQLTQETAAELEFNGERYRFGTGGIAQRLRYVGSPLAGEGEPGTLTVGLTGSASVIAREVIAVNVGAPAATPAASVASVEECPELQPWLGQTLDALSQAQALGTEAGVQGELADLNADALSQVATDLAALGQTQRGLEVPEAPEAAAGANRLVVTALSTYARGLEVIANAAAAQDADLLAQGQSVLADGSQLLQRGEEAVSALAAACASPPQSASA